MGRYADAPLPHLIAGRRVLSRSGETFTNHSPIDGRALGEVAAGDAVDIDAAAQAAHGTFLDWRSRSGTERKAILHAVADLIVERRHEIAVTECVDTGQTMRFMSAAACEEPTISASSPTGRRVLPTGCRFRQPTTSTTRLAIRSALSA